MKRILSKSDRNKIKTWFHIILRNESISSQFGKQGTSLDHIISFFRHFFDSDPVKEFRRNQDMRHLLETGASRKCQELPQYNQWKN